MKEQEESALRRQLTKRHFRCFSARGKPTKDEKGEVKERGGVMIWVHRSSSAEQVLVKVLDEVQVLVVKVRNVYFMCTYAPPTSEAKVEYVRAMCELMDSEGWITEKIWFWAGDHNEQPWEDSMSLKVAALKGRVVQTQQGTRWDSERIVDYAITNTQREPECLTERDEHISDHKILTCEVEAEMRKDNKIGKLKQPPSWEKPTHVREAEWRKLVESKAEEWCASAHCQKLHEKLGRSQPDQGMIDEEWDLFMQGLHYIYREAAKEVIDDIEELLTDAPRTGSEQEEEEAELLKKELEHLRKQVGNQFYKGQLGCHTKTDLQWDGTRAAETMKQLKLSKWLGRARSMQNWMKKETWQEIQRKSGKKAWKRVWKDLAEKKMALPDAQKALQERISKADEERRKLEKAKRATHLKQWKERMQSGIKEVSRWMKSRTEGAASPTLVRKGEKAKTCEEATRFIRQHWEETWDFQRGQKAADTRRQIAKGMAKEYQQLGIHDMEWKKPSEEMLWEVWKDASGTGSPDGWTGREVARLPRNCM
eukprot:362034-Karenia_brevis.AAC.1